VNTPLHPHIALSPTHIPSWTPSHALPFTPLAQVRKRHMGVDLEDTIEGVYCQRWRAIKKFARDIQSTPQT